MIVLFLCLEGKIAKATDAYEVLSCAIEKSEISLVKKLLEKKSLTDEEQQAALDLAQEVIIKRRQEIEAEVSCRIKEVSAAGVMTAMIGAFSILLLRIPRDEPELGVLVVFLAGIVSGMVYLKKGLSANDEQVLKNYKNAVAIKQLLFFAKKDK